MPNLSTLITNTVPPSSISADKLSGGQSGSAPIYGCRAWVNFNGELTNVINNSYSRSGTTVTVTRNTHGLSTGNRLSISSATDTGLNTEANTASREIIVTGPDSFTFQTNSTGTATGTLTYALGIRASGNIASVVRTNQGRYTINFITPMLHSEYSVSTGTGIDALNGWRAVTVTQFNTNSMQIEVGSPWIHNVAFGTFFDSRSISLQVFA